MNSIWKADRPATLSRYLPHFLYRPVLLPIVIGMLLLLLTLGVLLTLSWSSLHRLQPVHTHLREINRLHQTGLWLEETFVSSLLLGAPIEKERLNSLRAHLDKLLEMTEPLVAATPERLQKLQQTLDELSEDAFVSSLLLGAPIEKERPADLRAQLDRLPAIDDPLAPEPLRLEPPPLNDLNGGDSRQMLLTILRELNAVIAAEIAAHDRLLARVERDNQAEFRIAVLAIIAFPVLLAVILYLLRNRILVPLRNLGTFMNLLAQRDYSRAPTAGVDPLLAPLFEHYNRLVTRLMQLEQEHQVRQQSLENEVRMAARTLLEHQRDLANAERLAAVGEVAAGVAHELRNPLAGVQMALSNLRRQLSDPEQSSRLDAALKELKRTSQLLNTMLDQSRQAPEPMMTIELARNVEELLALVRYQIPAHIQLRQEIPTGLSCRLPQGRLHQALLNLIVNAAQSIGEQPGTITIGAAREQDKLRIQVSDDGPGLPAELIRSGVRAFATWRESGTGLGLAMVRRFARDLGGELKLSNQVPHGACITLLFPWNSHHG
ncbi:MAG: ATP-binding protein [Candidatus Competibacteraceae bacterium]